MAIRGNDRAKYGFSAVVEPSDQRVEETLP
jgi:hypothetical protein